jgi:hypothetical protein
MTAQEYMAEQTARMGQIIAHYVATTHPDKLNWQPQMEGSAPTRSVLEQVGECVVVNRHFAALLRGEDVQVPAGGWIGPDFADSQDAQNQVIASATQLAEVIRALDEEALNRAFQLRRGPTTGKNLMIMAYRNMAYHGGQINLIQLLTGDAEWHMPPAWY